MNYASYIFFFCLVLVSCNQGELQEQRDYIENLEERNEALERELQKARSENDSLSAQIEKKVLEEARGYFVIGSTIDEVVEVMGEPSSYMVTAPEARRFYYGLSAVYFYQNKVISYDNLEGNLRVKVK